MQTIRKQLTEAFNQLPSIAAWTPERYASALAAIQGASPNEIALAIVEFIRAQLAATEAATKTKFDALNAVKEIGAGGRPLHRPNREIP